MHQWVWTGAIMTNNGLVCEGRLAIIVGWSFGRTSIHHQETGAGRGRRTTALRNDQTPVETSALKHSYAKKQPLVFCANSGALRIGDKIGSIFSSGGKRKGSDQSSHLHKRKHREKHPHKITPPPSKVDGRKIGEGKGGADFREFKIYIKI